MIYAFLHAQLGKPYVWGAEGPDAYDCSGLLFRAYWEERVPWRDGVSPFPRLTADEYYRASIPLDEPERPGDFGVMLGRSGTAYHVVMWAGEYAIEARGKAWGVCKSNRENVEQRGAIWRRFPWVSLEDEELNVQQDELLKQIRVSTVALSYIEPLADARHRGDMARYQALLEQRRAAVEAERIRLGLTKSQVSGI